MCDFNCGQTIYEKQATLEKTLREKSAVEAELDQLYAESLPSSTGLSGGSSTGADGGRTTGLVDDSDTTAYRLRAAEALRAEALARVESISNEMERNAMLYVGLYTTNTRHVAIAKDI